MALAEEINALIAAAEVVDAATATLKPALAALDDAEAAARASLAADGIGSRDHLSGGVRLKALALDLAGERGELAGQSLASIVSACWTPVIPAEPEEV